MQARVAVSAAVLAVGVAACTDHSSPTSPPAVPVAAAPLALISDGARNGGNTGFFFLPPLQPTPRSNANFDRGQFNPNLSPMVKICDGRDLTPAGECVHPLMKSGQPVVLNAVRGWDGLPDWVDPAQYHVLWRTKDYNLALGHPYRVLVKVYSALLGFLDIVPANKLLGALRITAGGADIGWLDDWIVPVRFWIGQGAVSCDTVQQIAVNDWALPLEAGYVSPIPYSPYWGQTFFQGTQVIFGGGPLFGTRGADVLVGYNPRGSSSFSHGAICTDRTAPFLHTVAALVPPVSGTGPAGLQVTQESYAYPSAPDNGYVLLKYTFTNLGTAPIADFYSGWLADWDLLYDGNVNSDLVLFDRGLGLGEATEFDTLTYPAIFAIVPMGPSGPFSFSAFTNDNSGPLPPHDPLTVPDYFPLLAGGLNFAGVGFRADIREMMGLAPLTIPAGQSTVAYFALVGGADRTAFEANVAAARAMGAALSGSPHP